MKNRFSLVLSALVFSTAFASAALADVLTVNADGSVQQVEVPQDNQQSNASNEADFQTFSRRGSSPANDVYATGRYSGRNLQSYPSPYSSIQGKHKNDKIVVQPGTDVIVNGDKTKIIIKPGGNYYNGYYPPYYAGYPYGYGYGYNYGYPANYGYYGGYPYYGYTYGPGTTTTTYNSNYLGYGFGGYTPNAGLGYGYGGGWTGGYSRPGGVNVTIGGGGHSFSSSSTVTVAPGSTMTISGGPVAPGLNAGSNPFGVPVRSR